MRLYEIVYIFDAALEEGAITEKLEKYHALLTGTDGEVREVEHWQIRQLAYAIKGQRSGYYAVAQVFAGAGNLAEFERLLRLDDDLMRYLLVLNEGEPTSGMSILAERPPREEDEDEEEEEEEEEEDDGVSPPEFSGGRGRRRRHEGPAVELLNFKDVSTLSRFLTEQGKILPKRTTKVSAQFQRQLGRAVKRARYLGLIPYVRDHEA